MILETNNKIIYKKKNTYSWNEGIMKYFVFFFIYSLFLSIALFEKQLSLVMIHFIIIL